MIYIYIYIVRDNEQRVTNDDSFLSHGIQIAAIIVVENRKTNQESRIVIYKRDCPGSHRYCTYVISTNNKFDSIRNKKKTKNKNRK